MTNLADIKGHENIKRAIEIAITGNHIMGIICVRGHGGTSLSEEAERISANIGSNVRCYELFDPVLMGTAHDLPIVVKMEPITQDTFFSAQKLETSEMIINRANAAKKVTIKSTDFDPTCLALAKNAMEKLELTPKQMSFIFKVSETIARLDGSEVIQAHHVAEAICYQNYK